MKVSRFNHFFPVSDVQYAAYNALSNSLALIDIEKLDAYEAFNSSGKSMPSDLVCEGRLALERHKSDYR